MWLQWILLIFTINQIWISFGVFEEQFCYTKRMKRNSYECSKLESYTPWPNDEKCKKFEVRRSPEGTFSKPVALASAGCSGSSFLSQMIERSSGFIVGTVEPILPNEYLFTQSHCNLHIWDGKSIMIETRDGYYQHLPDWYKKTKVYDGEEVSVSVLSKIFFQYRGIMIVRNPWNVLISSRVSTRQMIRFCTTCKKSNYRSELDFEMNGFTKFFRKGVSLWVNHLKSWISGSPDGKDMVIIQYEKLVENPGPELRRALKYLNMTVDEDRLSCTLKDPPNDSNPFKESYPNSKSIMTVAKIFDENSEANSILENGIVEINILMKEKGLNDKLDYKRPDLSGLVEGGAILRHGSTKDLK